MRFNKMYRPINFDSYIGNEVTKRKLINMLNNGTVPHSCIFEGDRGCGKTTVARILGKTLLCKSPREDGTACDECSNCVKINEKFIGEGGRVPGVPIQEIDINSTGKKDDILDLIEDMRTRPMGNSKKVYILDEIQVMSKQAQSSLLKVLEEPNEWLYIFLCTTDPEDLLVPIRSRLVPFKIKRPTTKEIAKRLQDICLAEGIAHDIKALELIVKVANRIPRDSIKHLETLATSNEEITYEVVQRDLEVVRLDTYIDYIEVFNKDIFHALAFINGLHENYGLDYEEFLNNLAEFVIDAFNLKTGVALDMYTEEEAKQMKKAFKTMTIEDLVKLLNLIEAALKLKNNPRYALVMLTLKMGFPEYFGQSTVSEVARDVRREESTSIKKYKENKKIPISNDSDDGEITEADLANLFPDSFIVEE